MWSARVCDDGRNDIKVVVWEIFIGGCLARDVRGLWYDGRFGYYAAKPLDCVRPCCRFSARKRGGGSQLENNFFLDQRLKGAEP